MEFSNADVLKKIILDCRSMETDLVMFTEIIRTCGECAKYSRRVFSISGSNKRFPLLPKYFLQDLPEHDYCVNGFYPFFSGASELNWQYSGNLQSWSNRPYIDERTPEQKRTLRTG